MGSFYTNKLISVSTVPHGDASSQASQPVAVCNCHCQLEHCQLEPRTMRSAQRSQYQHFVPINANTNDVALFYGSQRTFCYHRCCDLNHGKSY
ncbi:hypothetical protein FIBSPDRAFT_285117 [Athelia psychrophila]|uniref:Uncharacterized protein n=1 Tax=Athelia psychrophila TaxID=1759441 RepID=A0A166R6L9_9AGAM|nr:hypothetical protein FIBSPDRAFT_285117 [Fibularhizoctonia sp. CBS 109695]